MHAGGNCGSGIKESFLPFHELRRILTLLPNIIFLLICHTQGKMLYGEISYVCLKLLTKKREKLQLLFILKKQKVEVSEKQICPQKRDEMTIQDKLTQ
jgi:hypothetical protein